MSCWYFLQDKAEHEAETFTSPPILIQPLNDPIISPYNDLDKTFRVSLLNAWNTIQNLCSTWRNRQAYSHASQSCTSRQRSSKPPCSKARSSIILLSASTSSRNTTNDYDLKQITHQDPSSQLAKKPHLPKVIVFPSKTQPGSPSDTQKLRQRQQPSAGTG